MIGRIVERPDVFVGDFQSARRLERLKKTGALGTGRISQQVTHTDLGAHEENILETSGLRYHQLEEGPPNLRGPLDGRQRRRHRQLVRERRERFFVPL